MKFDIDRITWMLFRRRTIAKQILGFSAHRESYADKQCSFSDYNRIYKGAALSNVELGRFSYIGVGTRSGNCSYGAFCSIGPEAIIGGMGRHPTTWLTTHPSFFSTRGQVGLSFSDTNAFEELVPTTVGNDVWVGARAIILDGVFVGDGAIVAAGAVVSRDVPPYAVVAGVPARTIRYRFDSEVIEELLDWKWWNLSTEILKGIAPDFVGREDWRLSDIKALREKVLLVSKRGLKAGRS
jgi:acetyltransferase-like isoleucine patch superfamily enzyme